MSRSDTPDLGERRLTAQAGTGGSPVLSYLAGTLAIGGLRGGRSRAFGLPGLRTPDLGERLLTAQAGTGGSPVLSYPPGTLAIGGLHGDRGRAFGLPGLRRSTAALGAALVTAAVAAGVPVAPVAAQETCEGVTVVVDFGSLAPEPEIGCAPDPADGLDALAQAGFSVTEVASIRGMVCSIDALPESDCGSAPPADAYWSYWHANAGDDEWTYSMVGGADATPDRGDVEGWAFGDGSEPPAVAPGDAVAAAPETGSETGSGANLTWIAAVAALAVIGGLAAWRLRRDRRA